MAIINNKQALKSVRQRNFLARDFDGFRTVILDYARQYYPDRIQDFSEASLGGLFLDMAAYVGDSMSFYLDHLYGELNYDTAVETRNIERSLINAGIQITGASPALVNVDFYIEVPANNDGTPEPSLLPTINAGTILRADNGTKFTLTEDVKFWQVSSTGVVSKASNVEQSNGRAVAGEIVTYILKKPGLCTSGDQKTQTFTIGEFVQFRKLTLSEPDVSQVISVTDGYGNIYYEVDSLSNDVVYKNVLNTNLDSTLVKDTLKVIPAPYRFSKSVSLSNRTTTLTFGGGTADDLEDDVIPDPSEFAIPLVYSQTFTRTSIDPQRLLRTSTLGVAASNTTLSITYRHGGGLSHNVAAGSIRSVESVSVFFPENPEASLQTQIRNSIEAFNSEPAAGGEDAPPVEDLVALIPAVKHSQERVVTKQDLLARVYTMPSNFGRVFRAAITKNDNNPLGIQLHIISRDAEEKLIISPNALKDNLRKYLNSYRMISDAIDILDAQIVNLELTFQIVADPALNKSTLLQSIIADLKNQLNVKNFQINQPIILSDIISTIFSRQGVLAVDSVEFRNLYGGDANKVKNRVYSSAVFDVKANTKNSIIYPPQGGIFEIKYPEINIIGKAVSNV